MGKYAMWPNMDTYCSTLVDDWGIMGNKRTELGCIGMDGFSVVFGPCTVQFSLVEQYTHYDDYRPPITGHPVESIDFFEFFMATTTLFEMVNGHFPFGKFVGCRKSLSMSSTGII